MGKHVDEDDEEDADVKKRKRFVPPPPSDESIRTLYIGGIDWKMSEDLLKNKFCEYGEILSVVLLPDRKFGFLTFASRESAENAMQGLFDCLYLNEVKCSLNWAKGKGQTDDDEEVDDAVREKKKTNEKL